MELGKALSERRSIRKYAPCVVKTKEIKELVSWAQLAPSWKNSQSARFYAVVSEEMKKKVRSALASFNEERTMDVGAYIVASVVHGISGYSSDGTGTHLGNGFECFDCGLAVENLLLKAHEMGYGTLVMGIYDEKKIRELLNVPREENIVVVIALGKADIEPEMPKRKDTDEVLKLI